MSAKPPVYDRFEAMQKAELQTYLHERGHMYRAGTTNDELRRLCREAATLARLRHRTENATRALNSLRGRGFWYTTSEAATIIEETIADAADLARALGEARSQIAALRQQLEQ
jgi:hypothetical protein